MKKDKGEWKKSKSNLRLSSLLELGWPTPSRNGCYEN
jgi:hypothetical protein